MKKALSFVLAMATMASMAVTAFAQTNLDTMESTQVENGIYFAADESGATIDGLLTPGEEYSFTVQIKEEGQELTDLTEEHLEGKKFDISAEEGKSNIETFKIEEAGGKYNLIVETRKFWPSEQQLVNYTVKLINRSTGKAEYTNNLEFFVGYEYADDAQINSLEEGDYIEVDPNRPVYTKAQLEKIAKLNNYKKVTFTNGSWKYTVNVTDMDNLNLLHNESAIKEIITQFEDQDFKFVSFPAGPTFNQNGKVEIDVSSEIEGFNGSYYVYRYLNGKLSLIDSTFSEEDETLSFETRTLGRFVITNKEITDEIVTAPESGNESSSNAGNSSSNSSSSNSSSSNQPSTNPDTGVSGSMAMVMAVSVLGLASVGAVFSKKK